jgi:hypothetical protein
MACICRLCCSSGALPDCSDCYILVTTAALLLAASLTVSRPAVAAFPCFAAGTPCLTPAGSSLLVAVCCIVLLHTAYCDLPALASPVITLPSFGNVGCLCWFQCWRPTLFSRRDRCGWQVRGCRIQGQIVKRGLTWCMVSVG